MTQNRDNAEMPLSDAGKRNPLTGNRPQYASGGAHGMQMASPTAAGEDPYADIKGNNAGQEDFLMIQLSSFEGRVGH